MSAGFPTVDERLSALPLVGSVVHRLYAYFRRHLFFADVIHLVLGVGLGMLVAGGSFRMGILLVLAGLLGHVHAYLRGSAAH